MNQTSPNHGHVAVKEGYTTLVLNRLTLKIYTPPTTKKCTNTILIRVVYFFAKEEVVRLFHNVKKAVPLRINLNELGFPRPPTPIKSDNSAAEGIVTNMVRGKSSKAIYMRFYWMKDQVKQNVFFVY